MEKAKGFASWLRDQMRETKTTGDTLHEHTKVDREKIRLMIDARETPTVAERRAIEDYFKSKMKKKEKIQVAALDGRTNDDFGLFDTLPDYAEHK